MEVIKTASLSLIDSGFVSKDEGGTQESLIANRGAAITLKGVNLSFTAGQTIDNEPEVGTEDNAVLNPVSVTNPIIKITGSLDRATANDMAKVIFFDTLRRSKGIKLLYYNSTDADMSGGAATDGWDNVISRMGRDNLDGNNKSDIVPTETIVDTHTALGGVLYNSGDPFPHLHIYVKSITIPQNARSQKLKYTLTCEVSL